MRSHPSSSAWKCPHESRRGLLRNAAIGAVAAAFSGLFPDELRADAPKLALVAEFYGHKGQVHHIQFSDDGKTLVTSSADGTVRFWTIPELKEPFPVKVESPTDDKTAIHCLPEGGAPFIGFLPDGETLVVADQLESVIVWNRKPGRVRVRLWDAAGRKECTPRKAERVLPVNPSIQAMTSDGKVLLNVRYSRDQRSVFELWDRDGGKQIGSLSGTMVSPNGKEFSPDGKQLAAASGRANEIKIWDTNSHELKRTITPASRQIRGLVLPGEPCGVAFSPDSNLLSAACDNYSVQVWDSKSGELKHVLPTEPAPVRFVAFSPDGRYIAAGDAHLYIWDMKTPKLLCDADARGVIRIKFSPDSKYLALSFDGRNQVQLWGVQNPR